MCGTKDLSWILLWRCNKWWNQNSTKHLTSSLIFFQLQSSTPGWSPTKDCHAKHLPRNLRSWGGHPVRQQQAQPSAATPAVAKASLDFRGWFSFNPHVGSFFSGQTRSISKTKCVQNMLPDESNCVSLFALCISSLFSFFLKHYSSVVSKKVIF